MHSSTILQAINTHLDEQRAQRLECVQGLWSGYGEIARYSLPDSGGSCIAKVIRLQTANEHPRGWGGERSHLRKLSSYHNEQRFYADLSPFTSALCKVPKLIAHGQDEQVMWMLLEDLDASGYTYRFSVADHTSALSAVSWLAYFHATYLDRDISSAWSQGNYWHLSTRPDEWQNIPSVHPLKAHAQNIDDILQNAQYQTLLHGDAKLANFCFGSDHDNHPDDIAAVDFQYVGRGVGIIDLVYLIGSCYFGFEVKRHAHSMLELYFIYLREAVAAQARLRHVDLDALEKEWRSLYCIAWADFERFLLGWAPSHKKLSAYSAKQVENALKYIKTNRLRACP